MDGISHNTISISLQIYLVMDWLKLKKTFINYFLPLPLWLFLALNCVEISTRCAPCYFTQFKVKFDTLIYYWPVYDSLIFSSRLQFECHFDSSVLTFSVHFVRISVYLFNEVVNTLLVNGVERCLLTYLVTYYLSRFVKVCPIVVEVSGIFCQVVIHTYTYKYWWKRQLQILDSNRKQNILNT